MKRIIVLVISWFLFASCTSTGRIIESEPHSQRRIEQGPLPYPEVKFAVFSDPHLFAPVLGKDTATLRKHVMESKKLLHVSEEVLSYTVNAIIADTSLEFVVIPGDLTKDGEYESHELFSRYLARIRSNGKKVYVVPGNHDVCNRNAVRFSETGTEPVQSVTPEQFSSLYHDFGYSEALSCDEFSLSYIAEPVEGLWLFALDSCAYGADSTERGPEEAGRFSSETIEWIREHLESAVKKGKSVIGVMHHGIVEHFETQQKYFPGFLVQNFERIGELFALYDMRLVFTGHFHAQDIALSTWENGKYVFDIETSALVTFPCAFRTVRITGDQMVIIRTHRIESLDSLPEFSHYARMLLIIGVSNTLKGLLHRYGFSEREMRSLVPQMVRALIAHTNGDEKPPPVLIDMKHVHFTHRLLVELVMDLVRGSWNDKAPPDNDIIINIRDMTWEEIKESK